MQSCSRQDTEGWYTLAQLASDTHLASMDHAKEVAATLLERDHQIPALAAKGVKQYSYVLAPAPVAYVGKACGPPRTRGELP